MATNESTVSETTLDRRRMLQGLAAAGVVAAAGCLGDDDDDDDDDDPTADPGDEDVAVELEDVRVGGTLEFGNEREGMDHVDVVDSSLADDSIMFNVIYDGLTTTTPEGEIINWMAEEYDVVDAQDVDQAEYLEYAEEYEIADVVEGTPVFDLDWPNRVMMMDPDDVDAVGEGDLGAGDTMSILTRDEMATAVEEGEVYGTKVEGRLHEGIEFHNGEECTAGNVVNSYDRYVESVNEAQQFASFIHASAPEGEDGYAFELYAEQADAIAETDIQPFRIFPSEHIELEPGEISPLVNEDQQPIGTGPYEFDEMDEGRFFRMSKNENYWLETVGLDAKEWWDGVEGDVDFPASPVVDNINVQFQPEEGQRVAALQDQTIDVSYEISPSDLTNFSTDDDLEDFRVSAAPSTGFLFMQFPINTDVDSELTIREVRQAVSALIPREDIVRVVEDGWADPAELPYPRPAADLASHSEYDDLIDDADWSYPTEPDEDLAEQLLDEAGVDTPVPIILRTNSDDSVRQDKVELIVGQLNASGLFEASMETPADLTEWTGQELYVDGARHDYAEDNATATIGIASGFDPDGYARFVHHSLQHNGCCNFFHPAGTFEWEDMIDDARFGEDVAEDDDLRRERYDDLWPEIATDIGNAIIDYSLEAMVVGPRIGGMNAYPDRRGFLWYGLHAPFDQQIGYIDDEDLPLLADQ